MNEPTFSRDPGATQELPRTPVPAAAEAPPPGAPPPATFSGAGFARADQPNAHRRPRPSLATSAGLIGGVLILGGLFILVFARIDTHQQLIAGIVGAVLFAAGLAGLRLLPDRARPAGSVLSSIGATVTIVAVVVHGDSPSRWVGVLILVLVSALHFGLWRFPGFGDRPWMFAVSVLTLQVALVTAVGFLVGEREVDDFGDTVSIGGIDSGSALLGRNGATITAVVSCIIGVLMLVGAWTVARTDEQGIATPLLFGGALGGTAGALAVAGDNSWASIIAVFISGAVLVFVGAELGRRGTNWWGTALLGGGIIALLAKVVDAITDDGDTASLIGGLLALMLGAGLIVAARATASRRSGAPQVDAPD